MNVTVTLSRSDGRQFAAPVPVAHLCALVHRGRCNVAGQLAALHDEGKDTTGAQRLHALALRLEGWLSTPAPSPTPVEYEIDYNTQ